MKLFGSLTELLQVKWRKDSQEITSRPNQSTTYTGARDIQLPPGDTNHVLVSEGATQALTGKTINADLNTLSNIEDADIKAAAGINATKLADGSVDNTEFQRLNSAGTAGAGNLVTTDGSQALTSKSIDGDDNTITDLAITSLKTVLADANKVLRRDASGVAQSGNTIPNTSALVTTDASQVITGKTIDGDDNTVQDLPITSLKTVLGDANKVLRRNAAGVAQSGNTIPNTSALVTTDSSETQTNKTLTSPTINTPTITAPVVTGGATVRGDLLLQNTSGPAPTLQIFEDPDNGTNKITVKAPDSLSADWSLTLPGNDGDSGQVLTTDGNGISSWTTVATVEETINTTAITGTTTIGTTSANVRILSSASAFDLTLDNTFVAGRQLKLINEGTNEVTLKANDGSTIRTIYRKTTAIVECRSTTPTTNTNWLGINQVTSPAIDISSSVTLSASWGTVTNSHIFYRRRGSGVRIFGDFQAGTVTGSSGTLTFNNGITMNTTYVTAGVSAVGEMNRISSGAQTVYDAGNTVVWYYDGTNTRATMGRTTTSVSFDNNGVSNFIGSNEKVSFWMDFEVTGWTDTSG